MRPGRGVEGWRCPRPIVALPYYKKTLPVRAMRASEQIREVLADHRKRRLK